MRDSKIKRVLVNMYEFYFERRRRLIRELKYWKYSKNFHLRIMSPQKTLSYIKKKGVSIARFGDGEFDMISGIRDLKFQKSSPELGKALKKVLNTKKSSLLLCVPRTFKSIRGCNWHAAMYWTRWGIEEQNLKPIVEKLNIECGKEYVFGDALITRPFIDWTTKRSAKHIWRGLKRIWNNRDLLIVEGCQTRLGVGNDLLANAKSIKRILAPSIGAFEKYDAILETTLNLYRDELVLIALGPTATVLAAELSARGIQALDVGHMDIEYEWYCRGDKNKAVIPGKFVNEAVGGQNPIDCYDVNYLEQIVAKIN